MGLSERLGHGEHVIDELDGLARIPGGHVAHDGHNVVGVGRFDNVYKTGRVFLAINADEIIRCTVKHFAKSDDYVSG